MIEAGIFDVGGVLLDWQNEPMYADMQRTLQISEAAFHAGWSAHIGSLRTGEVSIPEFWQRFYDTIDIDAPLPTAELFTREFSARFAPREDVLALVRSLKKQNVKLAVLSNSIQPHTAFIRDSVLLRDFDILVFSDEVGVYKPDPESYTMTLTLLHAEAERTFFVDDVQENVDAANELGMHGVVFSDAVSLMETFAGLRGER